MSGRESCWGAPKRPAYGKRGGGREGREGRGRGNAVKSTDFVFGTVVLIPYDVDNVRDNWDNRLGLVRTPHMVLVSGNIMHTSRYFSQ